VIVAAAAATAAAAAAAGPAAGAAGAAAGAAAVARLLLPLLRMLLPMYLLMHPTVRPQTLVLINRRSVAGVVLVALREAQKHPVSRQLAAPLTVLADGLVAERVEARREAAALEAVFPIVSAVEDGGRLVVVVKPSVDEVHEDEDEDEEDEDGGGSGGSGRSSDEDGGGDGEDDGGSGGDGAAAGRSDGGSLSTDGVKKNKTVSPPSSSSSSLPSSSSPASSSSSSSSSPSSLVEPPSLANQVAAFSLLARLLHPRSPYRLGDCFRQDMPQVRPRRVDAWNGWGGGVVWRVGAGRDCGGRVRLLCRPACVCHQPDAHRQRGFGVVRSTSTEMVFDRVSRGCGGGFVALCYRCGGGAHTCTYYLASYFVPCLFVCV
jgi:hypothetical protein